LTVAVRPKSAYKKSNVDLFLSFIKAFLILMVSIGLLAFIAQQIDPNNPFAEWRNEGATRLGWPALKGLLIAGTIQGFMYGLIALGYSMVYGVLGFINFAHGEVFMVGGMSGWIVSEKLFESGLWEDAFLLALIIVILISIAVSTLTAVIIERVAYRPLRGSPRLIPLITSIGVSFFLQYTVSLLLGPASKSFPVLPEWLTKDRTPLDISGTQIMVLVVAIVSMAGLWYYVENTKTGKAMRAVAEDKEIAALMGIDVDKTIVRTFAIGGAMAGVAGIMWGLLFKSLIFTSGFLPGIKAFTAAVVGGVGNLGGAMAGGLSLGVAESTAPLVLLEPLGIPGVSQLKDAVAFVLLISVLLFKPTGLFGERLSDDERA
jgi:branched-chain amino acid transport system permease protein